MKDILSASVTSQYVITGTATYLEISAPAPSRPDLHSPHLFSPQDYISVSLLTLFQLISMFLLFPINAILPFCLSDDMAIVVGSLAKLFVGELVETCTYSLSLQLCSPSHLRNICDCGSISWNQLLSRISILSDPIINDSFFQIFWFSSIVHFVSPHATLSSYGCSGWKRSKSWSVKVLQRWSWQRG